MFFCRKIGNNNIHSAYVYDMEFTQHMEFTLQKHGTWYAKVSGWWYTYPSEKWWSSSVGMIFPFPTFYRKSNQIPWFQTTSQSLHLNPYVGHGAPKYGEIYPQKVIKSSLEVHFQVDPHEIPFNILNPKSYYDLCCKPRSNPRKSEIAIFRG